MTHKIFNPDIAYHGAASNKYRQQHEKMTDSNTEFSLETHCPYDKTICKQKLLHFDMWKETIANLSAGKVNRTFVTRGDMFHDCPVPELNCIRRIRYQAIVDALQKQQR
ncbi:MAG: hypothetical protein E7006_02900 [Alphaproteobacteria bacterium]|nr:hypothetical protein [Alphaproteobacteria bacterium]